MPSVNYDGMSVEDLKRYLARLAKENNQLKKNQKLGLVWEDQPDEQAQLLENKIPVIVSQPSKTIEAKMCAATTSDASTSLKDNSNDTNSVNGKSGSSSAEEVEENIEPASSSPPVETQSKPNHKLIKGDNLHALIGLLPEYRGRVDVIYIDPPYNTGNKDFIYNDDYVDKEDGYSHSKWLSFMHRRLLVAYELLSETGVIFVSIDDNEQAHLKLLMDGIFGEKNFRNSVTVSRQRKNINSQFIADGIHSLNTGFEYIFIYTKNTSTKFNPIYEPTLGDRSSKGYWKGFWNNADRPTMRYELFNYTPSVGQWKWEQNKALEAVSNYDKYLNNFSSKYSLEEYWRLNENLKFIRHNENGKGKNKGVEHWIPPSAETLRTSNWNDIPATKKEVVLNFDSPKNRKLIKALVNFSKISANAVILDFFAGSGTTGHAVAELNAEDGGSRECILVTDGGKVEYDNEGNKLDGKMVDIADEVTYERMRRVLTGEDWADGKDHPSLGQGLEYSVVELVDVRQPVVEDYDDEGEPVFKISSDGSLVYSSLNPEELEGLHENITPELVKEWSYWKETGELF